MSDDLKDREVWQRGSVTGVPGMLQPVAHALLQAVEELERFTVNLPAEKLWERPANVASVGFHLMHIRGVVDGLFTYARGESLTADQLRDLTLEKQKSSDGVSPAFLVDAVRTQVNKAIEQLRNTSETKLTEGRTLGRKQIPTTVIGLLFHAAEHTQRHVGQLYVTTKIVNHREG